MLQSEGTWLPAGGCSIEVAQYKKNNSECWSSLLQSRQSASSQQTVTCSPHCIEVVYKHSSYRIWGGLWGWLWRHRKWPEVASPKMTSSEPEMKGRKLSAFFTRSYFITIVLYVFLLFISLVSSSFSFITIVLCVFLLFISLVSSSVFFITIVLCFFLLFISLVSSSFYFITIVLCVFLLFIYLVSSSFSFITIVLCVFLLFISLVSSSFSFITIVLCVFLLFPSVGLFKVLKIMIIL